MFGWVVLYNPYMSLHHSFSVHMHLGVHLYKSEIHACEFSWVFSENYHNHEHLNWYESNNVPKMTLLWNVQRDISLYKQAAAAATALLVFSQIEKCIPL